MFKELPDGKKTCERCKYDWGCSKSLCPRGGHGGTHKDMFTESAASLKERAEKHIARLEAGLVKIRDDVDFYGHPTSPLCSRLAAEALSEEE